MKSLSKSTSKRFPALDLHKHYLVVGGANLRQDVVLNPRRISLQKWPAWAKKNLLSTVLEATTNAWEIYDQVATLVDRTIAQAASPSKAAKSYGGSWLKPPGVPLTLTPTGKPNTSDWSGA